MSLSPKQQFIEAFFVEFGRKIARLEELRSKSFQDEAFTLCLVYIDRLAPGHYGGKHGRNRENFWRALKELSGNALFAMVHPQHLLEQTKAKCFSATSLIESIANRQPHALLEEDKLAEEIRNSSLTDTSKIELVSNAWRASIANISYDRIRSAEVHGSGSGGLCLDETIYDGKMGVTLHFEIFYDALNKVFRGNMEMSIRSSQWFGNHNGLKDRPSP